MRRDLEFIGDTLARAVEARSVEARVAKGLELRKTLIALRQAGIQADHYRIQWVPKTAIKVIEYLQQLCREFDQEHPEDAASTADFMDVIQAAAEIAAKAFQQATKPLTGTPERGINCESGGESSPTS